MSYNITDYPSVVAVAISAQSKQGLPAEFFEPFVTEVVGPWIMTRPLWETSYRRAMRYAPFIVISKTMLSQWALYIADNVKSQQQRKQLFERSVWGVMYAYKKMPPKAYEVLLYLQYALGFTDKVADTAQVNFPFIDRLS